MPQIVCRCHVPHLAVIFAEGRGPHIIALVLHTPVSVDECSEHFGLRLETAENVMHLMGGNLSLVAGTHRPPDNAHRIVRPIPQDPLGELGIINGCGDNFARFITTLAQLLGVGHGRKRKTVPFTISLVIMEIFMVANFIISPLHFLARFVCRLWGAGCLRGRCGLARAGVEG